MGILDRARIEWVAAAFGLIVGTTMVYVPYEFGGALFQLIYPHIRLLGSVFLVGSAMMLAALLYPTWPAWFGWLGRVLFLGGLALYWWTATVLPRGATGVVLYPLMAFALLAETVPRWRGRGFLAWFLGAVGVAFGVLMLVAPERLSPFMYQALQWMLRPFSLVFLGAGVVLLVGLVRSRERPCRLALGMLGLLFLYLGVAVGASASWVGTGLYSVLFLACLLLAMLRRMPQPSGVRWRLFRGMALSSVLPILAVGSVASFLAQKAIEHELRSKAQQAVASEVTWLEQTVSWARSQLRAQSQDPVFLTAARARDRAGMQARVDLLVQYSEMFDAAWVLDGEGNVLAPSSRHNELQGNFAHRDYFKEAGRPGQVFLSRPFLGVTGRPLIVFAAPVDAGQPRPDIFIGGTSLMRLTRETTLASRSYHVELFDRRDGSLLRETDRGQVLSRAPILSLLGGVELDESEGMTEAFDSSGRRLLIAHAQVPETPWTVAVTSDLREAFSPVTRMSGLVVSIAVLAGAVSLLLSRWVGRDVADRLETLRDGFASLGTLPLDHPVPARGDDEVAQLTSGFNEMATRIERTQKELREAIAIRDQFLSMASHELRTPLTPLKATVELLLRQADEGRGLDPVRQRSTLERLLRQVQRLGRLVGDMLDVSRMQSGRFSLTRTQVDLSALAREIVDRIQHAWPERSTPILLELPDRPVVGAWDEQRLDQLLTNLVENALRYSPPGSPVRVELRFTDVGVELSVEDQGIGVPSESLPSLFTPFFRAQNAARHYAGGLGLGLAICREIVERHGGAIQARSEGVGQGTRFLVSLPLTPPLGVG